MGEDKTEFAKYVLVVHKIKISVIFSYNKFAIYSRILIQENLLVQFSYYTPSSDFISNRYSLFLEIRF